jgi:hypothetical protein
MKTELRTLHPEQPDAGTLVPMLEHALELAREGKISSCVVVFVWRDGSVSSQYTKLHSVGTMIGALELAKHKIMKD